MAYSVGNVIQATDFNGFVSTNSANINGQWGIGSAGFGWGQTDISTVSPAGTVTATNWSSLVNTLTAMGGQTGTALTSRSAPTAGSIVIFPSNEPYYHESKEIKRGIKYMSPGFWYKN